MKKVFTLLTLLLCAVTGAWATDYYTPSADEVIILNSIYDGSKADAGYSNHAAVVWGGTASTNNKKAGDPDKGGEATGSNVPCYSIKGNGKGKNITLTIEGCSKVILYHEKNSGRYPQLKATPEGGALTTLDGEKNVYYNEFNLDGTSSYSILLHGTSSGSDDQDFYVYAIKLVKAASGPVDPIFSLTESEIVVGESSQVQVGLKGNLDGITLTGLTSSDPSVATVNTSTGEITSVAAGTTTISFTASSAVDGKYNATSEKVNLSLTVVLPTVETPVITASGVFTDSKEVTISCDTEGATIKYSTNDGVTWTDYTAALNITETTTVKAKAVKDGYSDSEEVSATYTKVDLGSVIAYLHPAEQPASDITISKFSMNGFEMTSTAPLKYSTMNGFAYNFKSSGTITIAAPSYATITNIKISGFRNNDTSSGSITPGSGLTALTSTTLQHRNTNGILSEVALQVDAPSAGNSVSFSLSAEARFVVEVYGTGTPSNQSINPATNISTYVPSYNLDFSSVDGLEAYAVSSLSASSATLTKVTSVPANAGVILIGTAGAAYSVPAIASAESLTNKLKAAVTDTDVAANAVYVLKGGLFHLVNTASTVPAGKAYLLASDVTSPELSLDFDGTGEISTGIENVEAQKGFLDGEFYNLNGQRVAQPTKGLYIVNGRKVIIK